MVVGAWNCVPPSTTVSELRIMRICASTALMQNSHRGVTAAKRSRIMIVVLSAVICEARAREAAIKFVVLAELTPANNEITELALKEIP